MRIVVIFLLVFTVKFVHSQELKQLRHTKTADYKCDFYISFDEKGIRYHDTLHYYWFKAQAIHVTQGNSDGNILDGKFSKFYYSGQLAEQGEFKKGLKDGLWKTWYESGNLKTIYNYSNGMLSGEYVLYNEDGDIREKGKIKKGEKDIETEKVKKPKKDKTGFHWGEYKVDPEKRKEKEKKREENRIKREQKKQEKGGSLLDRIFKKKDKTPKKPKKDKKNEA
ncbi:MAG: hypothetical protein ABJG68_15730 [Crocinitomicaceae bacterium]